MKYEFDSIMGLDQLELCYEAHAVIGLGGEFYGFTVYLEDPDEETGYEIDKALEDFLRPYREKNIYLDIYLYDCDDHKAFLPFTLGDVKDGLPAIHGVLKALNTVPGIRSVIIGEMR